MNGKIKVMHDGLCGGMHDTSPPLSSIVCSTQHEAYFATCLSCLDGRMHACHTVPATHCHAVLRTGARRIEGKSLLHLFVQDWTSLEILHTPS